MNKEDLNFLIRLWINSEQEFYLKSHNFLKTFNNWQDEHGLLPENSPHAPVIQRMIKAASYHEECINE